MRPSSSPDANLGSHSARCSFDPATPTEPITSPFCMPTIVAALASALASSSATQPRKTAEFSNGRVSSQGMPNSPRSASPFTTIDRSKNSALAQRSLATGRTCSSRNARSFMSVSFSRSARRFSKP